ncbi:MAG: cytochrome c-type biogenesis protein [Burkholderiales bacterium]
MARVIALILALASVHLVWAKEAAPVADDPVLEQRMMALAAELRCLVCQNQTLADSNADLAVDLRNQIREKMKQGASEADIVEFLVARYGDFVLYRPPFKATTALLWLGPLLLLLAGLGALFFRIKRRRVSDEPELTEAEHKRARALLAGNGAKRQ